MTYTNHDPLVTATTMPVIVDPKVPFSVWYEANKSLIDRPVDRLISFKGMVNETQNNKNIMIYFRRWLKLRIETGLASFDGTAIATTNHGRMMR